MKVLLKFHSLSPCRTMISVPGRARHRFGSHARAARSLRRSGLSYGMFSQPSSSIVESTCAERAAARPPGDGASRSERPASGLGGGSSADADAASAAALTNCGNI